MLVVDVELVGVSVGVVLDVVVSVVEVVLVMGRTLDDVVVGALSQTKLMLPSSYVDAFPVKSENTKAVMPSTLVSRLDLTNGLNGAEMICVSPVKFSMATYEEMVLFVSVELQSA